MKKSLLSLAFAIMAIAASAQTVDKTFIFVDKNGKEVPNGSEIICDEIEDDGWSKMIKSGLHIKLMQDTPAYASMELDITRLDNGSVQHCFPGSCRFIKNLGVTTIADDAAEVTTKGNPDILSEWVFEGDGMCTVKYTILLMEKAGKSYEIAAKGSSVTVHFCNNKYPANVGAAAADIKNAQAYNLQGQPVGKEYKGLVIRNGHKFIQ